MKNNNFWTKANESFNAKERRDFNKWRHDLYVRAVAVRDLVHSLDISVNGLEDKGAAKLINDLMERVNEVPILKGDNFGLRDPAIDWNERQLR